jgi:dissimilatory sulfite reductase (desulfoviridin) alpha/beta subunit
VGLADTVGVDEDVLVQVADEGLGILLGDEEGLGVETEVGEGAQDLLVLELDQEEEVVSVVDHLVEVGLTHFREVIHLLARGEGETHFLELVLEVFEEEVGLVEGLMELVFLIKSHH